MEPGGTKHCATYPQNISLAPNKRLGISINRPDRPGRSDARGLPPQLRFAPLPRPSLPLDGNCLEGSNPPRILPS